MTSADRQEFLRSACLCAMSPASDRLIHSSLAAADDGKDPTLALARISDRQRIAVLLQASSLLSHFEVAGWRLVSDWQGARLNSRGLLCGVTATPGRDKALPQARLAELSALLFRADRHIAGRGQARRVVRALLERWKQPLTPIQPDQTVRHVLDEADFLWQPEFGAARVTLAAEHVRGSQRELWVAGPGWFRRPLLAVSTSRSDLEKRLSSNGLLGLWHQLEGRSDPRRLSVAGRWRAAVKAWDDSPPRTTSERVEMARALFALGRFADARAALSRLRSTDARILKAWCGYWLGKLGPARREINALEARRVSTKQLMELARVAVRVFGNSGDETSAGRWVTKVLEHSGGEHRLEAELIAATAAWDRNDGEEVDTWLSKSRKALDTPELAWRWHRVAGWQAMRRGDGQGVVNHFRAALAGRRRQLLPFEAAGMWNELAIGRSMQGELAGAERALVHASRLHGETQGPRQTTLAHFNLAEIRLRRGRLTGVEEILKQTTAENRRAGNRRGRVHDVALRARLELVRGRPGAALEHLSNVLEELEERGLEWQVDELRALAGRALGWLDRPAEAFTQLEQTTRETRVQFEPEERPALWALAGDRERALEEVVEGSTAALWRALLTGEEASEGLWRCLDELGDFRAARLVFDAESIAPGSVPAKRVRRAARVLRGLGAASFAENLEAVDSGPWLAVESFLDRSDPSPEAIAELFSNSGLADVAVRWVGPEDEIDLVEGPASGESISVRHSGGRLVATSDRIEPVLRALLRIVAGRWVPHRCGAGSVAEPAEPVKRHGPPAGVDGLVGGSESFVRAVDRATRLGASDVPLVILGETGTGKELVARRVHRSSGRSNGPFAPLNCAAVSEELLMSDLFGHVRGAFTGADRDRHGVFEAARGGTVFLDEIGDLPLEAQGFLLRVLQEGEVRRVGESLPRSVDVRVVAATHRDLALMVRQGAFREDLFFRIKVASVELPPLRLRGRDVMTLARHFLRKTRPGEEIRLTSGARSTLSSYNWPGNVRELQNVLSVAVALTDDGVVRRSDLELPDVSVTARETAGYHESVFNYRRKLVADALAASAGKQAEAARSLGMTRQALSYLVKKLRIEI